jgi:CubicO group peptidase (beta-lactamase class C family)
LLYNQNQFNGTTLIIKSGKEILKKSYDFANRESNSKLNENSVFESASVPKQFTAVSMILLKNKGKLKYTDKVNQYFPELHISKEVSIRNLLNHSS